jgi:hypothetical protein
VITDDEFSQYGKSGTDRLEMLTVTRNLCRKYGMDDDADLIDLELTGSRPAAIQKTTIPIPLRVWQNNDLIFGLDGLKRKMQIQTQKREVLNFGGSGLEYRWLYEDKARAILLICETPDTETTLENTDFGRMFKKMYHSMIYVSTEFQRDKLPGTTPFCRSSIRELLRIAGMPETRKNQTLAKKAIQTLAMFRLGIQYKRTDTTIYFSLIDRGIQISPRSGIVFSLSSPEDTPENWIPGDDYGQGFKTFPVPGIQWPEPTQRIFYHLKDCIDSGKTKRIHDHTIEKLFIDIAGYHPRTIRRYQKNKDLGGFVARHLLKIHESGLIKSYEMRQIEKDVLKTKIRFSVK